MHENNILFTSQGLFLLHVLFFIRLLNYEDTHIKLTTLSLKFKFIFGMGHGEDTSPFLLASASFVLPVSWHHGRATRRLARHQPFLLVSASNGLQGGEQEANHSLWVGTMCRPQERPLDASPSQRKGRETEEPSIPTPLIQRNTVWDDCYWRKITS